MQEPIWMEVRRVGVLAVVEVEAPPPGGGSPGLREHPALAGAATAALTELLRANPAIGVPVDRLDAVDPGLLDPHVLTFTLHAAIRPAGLVPGGSGWLAAASLRRFRHAPDLPPGAAFEAAPAVVHAHSLEAFAREDTWRPVLDRLLRSLPGGGP